MPQHTHQKHSGQKRTKQRLEDRLAAYSALATSALAGAVIAATPAVGAECNAGVQKGKLCFTDVDPDVVLDFPWTINYQVDFDGDGDPEFRLSHSTSSGERSAFMIGDPASADIGLGVLGGFTSQTRGPEANKPGALVSGDLIGEADMGVTGRQILGRTATTFYGKVFRSGNFRGKGNRFIGVRFQLDGGTEHFGWIRIQIPSGAWEVTIRSFAYEMEPGTPITAGDEGDIFTDGFESGTVSVWSSHEPPTP